MKKINNLILALFLFMGLIFCSSLFKIKADGQPPLDFNKILDGDFDDELYSIIKVDDGYVAVGSSDSTNLGYANLSDSDDMIYSDAIIVKFNQHGEKVWLKNFGGNDEDKFLAVTAVNDGYIAVGYSWSSNNYLTNKGECDAIIVKYDEHGNYIWGSNYGGSDIDVFTSLTNTLDGVLLLRGIHLLQIMII